VEQRFSSADLSSTNDCTDRQRFSFFKKLNLKHSLIVINDSFLSSL